MKYLLSIFLFMSLIACSGSKSTNDAEGLEAGTELSDAGDFAEDFEDDFGDDFGDDFSEGGGDDFAAMEEESFEEPAFEEVTEPVAETEALDNTETIEAAEFVEEAPAEEFAPAPAPQMEVVETQPVQPTMSQGDGFHTVTKNETLMLIAFKIYGDYGKWKDLARWNSDKLGPGHTLRQGMQLKYEVPAQEFVWNPEGNPYLIQKGDTLGTISRDKYGTPAYWRNIWKNNTPLIKDPNRIFAGFTIYTPIIENRGVANDNI
ncbi:MAG: hypothetical protein CME66_00310 [Halobacteriovoraceae bacterium]|nr:hypothetical protein [Halobacteriovoraceae bacterium]|tara:strand:+ start:394 stop:1176 length:783 start_codon:yes stop_codon:yes gene_type:complete